MKELILESVNGESDIKCLAGNLPKIRVPSHERPDPSILELFLPPQFGYLVRLRSQRI